MNIEVNQFNGPCNCGREHRIEVKDIMISSRAAEALYESMKNGALSGYRRPMIICDENTKAAASGKLSKVWQLCAELVLSPVNLHADNHGVDRVHQAFGEMGAGADISGREGAGFLEKTGVSRADAGRQAGNAGGEPDLLLAVGSGTVHDLTRYIAHEKGIPFVSVPTAASVDGFVSTVAAMTWFGMKKTLPAVAPAYVYADTDIFSRAPWRLTASGVSDLLGKYVALADWRIVHEVTGEYICERICLMEEDAMEAVCQCMDGLKAGEADAYEKLMYALLLSGLAMQMIGNSRPASCAEHHVSHLWEMEVINDHVDALHGEKVSIGTVLNIGLYKRIAAAIRAGKCRVKPYGGLELELLKQTFGTKGLYDATMEENTPDPMLQVDPERLAEKLPRIAGIIEALPSEQEIVELLRRGDCVYDVKQIGLTEEIIPLTMRLSPYVRNRLSFNRIRKMLEY